MINIYNELDHHFLQFPIAEGVSKVPAYTKQDNVFLEAVSFEVDHGVDLSGVNWAHRVPKLRCLC